MNHLAMIDYSPSESWTEVKPGYWRDEFGVVWNRTIDKDIGNPDSYVLADGRLVDLRLPDVHDARRWARFPAFFRDHAEEFTVGTIGFSLFERAWTLRGMENVLVDMAAGSAFVEALLERITDWNLAAIDHLSEWPFDAIHLGDDWGQQRGMIMGPGHWRRFLRPCLERMFRRIKSKGKFVSIHSCGDVEEVLGDLVEIGLDIFNPLQPEVMDVEAVKRRYGKHLTFFGGISTQRTLAFGTPADVRSEVRRRIRVIGKDGGYIAAPAHDIPGDVSVENMVALIEELKSQSAP
jgi:uroporphyrinogen decarboxylase